MNVLCSHKRAENSKIFYIINITTFYLVNVLNISCRLSKWEKKSLNVGPKLPYLGILGWHLKKLKQPWIFQNTKFHAKLKTFKVGPKLLYLDVFGGKFKKLLSFLKSTFSSLSKSNVSWKTKKTWNVRPKIHYLGIFR